MLSPDDRQTLLDALRPPPGYGLGCAVGTTFSLNLDAALTAPAAFAIYAIADQDRSSAAEALELLESIRRHAGRFTIFFQAGQAAVPQQRRLFAFLEESIVPVNAPQGGVFHPKVWILRFDTANAPPVFRALIASRNLTYDHSWDSILRLDSAEEGTAPAVFDGTALADFVARLPGIAVTPLPEPRRMDIERLAEELRAVLWAPPPGVTSGRFHMFGLGTGNELPFPAEADRLIVISPFLSGGLLNRLPTATTRSIIVSRPDELRANGKTVGAKFNETYVLDADAMPAPMDGPGSADPVPPGDPAVPLEGLHAKAYVFDRGDAATVFTGSANASSAAFADNVEFLAELRGAANVIGVEALFAEPAKERQTFRSFLMPFAVEPVDTPERRAPEEEILDNLRREIARNGFDAHARRDGESDRYTLSFTSETVLPALPERLTWHAWPVTMSREFAREIDVDASFESSFTVSFEGITAFLANELEIGDYSTGFVLTARLLEAPENRATRLLGLMLGDASRFLRFLLMLLADDALDRYGMSALLDAAELPKDGTWNSHPDNLPLLEVMLRTLAQEPARLHHVDRLIRDLQAEPEGRALLPEGLLEVWKPIWAAAREVKG